MPGETSWGNALLLSPLPAGQRIGVQTSCNISPPPPVNELK